MDSREQVQAWRTRWTAVNRVTEREHAAGDAPNRLHILDRLYLSAPSPRPCVRPDEERVWCRMQALRHAYRANA